jgi:tight adherence protein B
MAGVLQPIFILASILSTMAAVFLISHQLTPLWDRFTQIQMGKLSSRYQQLGYPEEYLKFSLRLWTILLAVVLLVFGLLLKMQPLAIVLTLIVYAAPRRILDQLIRRRARRFRDQLTLAAIGMANATRSGLSPAQSLDEVANESAQPLKREFMRVVSDYKNGRSLGEALAERRRALNLDPFTLFTLTIETTLRQGGNLSACLVGLCLSLQEEQRLQGKLESDTSSGRQTILLLSLFPPVFLGIGLLTIPDGTKLLFTTFYGQCVLAAISALIYVGYGWAARILRFDV